MRLERKHVFAPLAAVTTALVGFGGSTANAATHPNTVKPDLNRVDCLTAGDPAEIIQSSSTNDDCFENAGRQSVRIYHIDWVYSGNNGVVWSMEYNNKYYTCVISEKDAVNTPSACTNGVVPDDEPTMTELELYAN